MSPQFVVSVLLCGGGLAVAVGYFALRGDPHVVHSPTLKDTREGHACRRRRRALGMAIMALVSVATFVGINWLEPLPQPLAFAAYWLLVLLLVGWLGLLALADILHTLRVQRSGSKSRTDRYVQQALRDRVSDRDPSEEA